ncbi:YkgJ family cysteine cluster protein [Candidatus Altiarchaeota archaeon]
MGKRRSSNACECCSSRGICCKMTVALNIADVRDIQSSTGIPCKDFIQLIPVDHARSLYHDLRVDGDYYYLSLRKDGSGDCIFLSESLCTIQEHKPLVCRLYPLGVEDGMPVARKNTVCPERCGIEGLNAEQARQKKAEYEAYLEQVKVMGSFAKRWASMECGRGLDDLIREMMRD